MNERLVVRVTELPKLKPCKTCGEVSSIWVIESGQVIPEIENLCWKFALEALLEDGWFYLSVSGNTTKWRHIFIRPKAD